MGTESRGPDSLPSFSEPLLLIDSPSIRLLSLPGLSFGATTSHIREIHEKQANIFAPDESYRPTINVLPDNVFLEIFDFCRKNHDPLRNQVVWKWHLLVHVCKRWRQIVFESPHRLNLQILCSFGTPVRKNLDIWPAFPIVIHYPYCYSKSGIPPDDEDDVIATLEHRDRLCSIMLVVADLQLEKITKAMQEPFPVLTDLFIGSADGNPLALPAEFLGGSAPCLQRITLCGTLYPALPALLLSTRDLVSLQLYRTPPTGYNLLGAMVACLAALPMLADLVIEFESQSATSRNDRIRLPPVTRIILPALTYFRFHGASEYLEDLVARIDAPQLKCISVDYSPQLVDYEVTQLSKFIDRSVGPKLTLSSRADVDFSSRSVTVYPHANLPSSDWRHAESLVSLKWVKWPVMDVVQLLSHFHTTLSNVIHLNLGLRANRRSEDMGDVDWLHLLRQFSAMQTLHVSPALAGNVALALEDITGEMVAEVLPSLDLVCIVDQPVSSIEKFIATLWLSNRHVTVVDTETEFNERLESYVSR